MATESPRLNAGWQVGNLIWIVAGLLYPVLSPATNALAARWQPLLVAAMGFSDELLAYRVAFTVFRLPLTALFGVLVALLQCALLPAVRPLARRWLIASAAGAFVSAFILLPTSLLLIEMTGSSSADLTRTFLSFWGPALFGVFVSLFERRAARGRLSVPAWFVVAGVLGVPAGAAMALWLT